MGCASWQMMQGRASSREVASPSAGRHIADQRPRSSPDGFWIVCQRSAMQLKQEQAGRARAL